MQIKYLFYYQFLVAKKLEPSSVIKKNIAHKNVAYFIILFKNLFMQENLKKKKMFYIRNFKL